MGKERSAVSGVKKADRVIFQISKYISFIGGAAVIVIMVVALIDVLLAKLFKSALPSATEWITYLNVVIVFPALAYVELERGHTSVDLFHNKFPPIVLKIIRILSLILAAAVMVFLAWLGFKLTIAKFLSGESSSPDAYAKLAFKIWIFGAVYTAGCGLCAVSFLWSLVREFTGLSIFEQPGQKPEISKEGGEH